MSDSYLCTQTVRHAAKFSEHSTEARWPNQNVTHIHIRRPPPSLNELWWFVV